MSEILTISIFYIVGMLILVAEVFLPSHGLLTVAGVGFLIAGIVMTFRISTGAGFVATIAVIIALPVFFVVAIRYWPRTRIGRKIAPANPVLTDEDRGRLDAVLGPLVGTTGRAISPLRPVGTCEFDGRRLECIAESGMIDAGSTVRAVALRGRNLTVRLCDGDQTTQT